MFQLLFEHLTLAWFTQRKRWCPKKLERRSTLAAINNDFLYDQPLLDEHRIRRPTVNECTDMATWVCHLKRGCAMHKRDEIVAECVELLRCQRLAAVDTGKVFVRKRSLELSAGWPMYNIHTSEHGEQFAGFTATAPLQVGKCRSERFLYVRRRRATPYVREEQLRASAASPFIGAGSS